MTWRDLIGLRWIPFFFSPQTNLIITISAAFASAGGCLAGCTSTICGSRTKPARLWVFGMFTILVALGIGFSIDATAGYASSRRQLFGLCLLDWTLGGACFWLYARKIGRLDRPVAGILAFSLPVFVMVVPVHWMAMPLWTGHFHKDVELPFEVYAAFKVADVVHSLSAWIRWSMYLILAFVLFRIPSPGEIKRDWFAGVAFIPFVSAFFLAVTTIPFGIDLFQEHPRARDLLVSSRSGDTTALARARALHDLSRDTSVVWEQGDTPSRELLRLVPSFRALIESGPLRYPHPEEGRIARWGDPLAHAGLRDIAAKITS